MPKEVPILEQIRQIRKRDGRYHENAYAFVLEGLEHTLRKIGQRRHLSGQELSFGLRDYAVHKFGLLARVVLELWGIRRTDDLGEIVFNMIDEGLMGKSERDAREDFHAVFDFASAFDRSFRMEGAWKIQS